jgi:gentisate 1,2-dioxygenase
MATTVQSPYTAQARFYASGEGFNITHSRIPAHVFRAERDAALSPATPTGLIALDLGGPLDIDFPATTPLILARYAKIRAGETLTTRFTASGEIYYVIVGAGESRFGGDALAWEAGDAFCLPGGATTTHTAEGSGAVLWVVTNEPQLAFEGAQAPAPGQAPIVAAHFPGDEIRRQLDWIHAQPPGRTTGKAVSLGNAALEKQRTCLPSFTLAMNSLAPRESQRAHRHNAVAVTLIVQGEDAYSMIEGARVPWERHTVMITPPGDAHSHHNDGGARALFLIVQDGGLHYHTRTMGFSHT